MTSRLNVEGLLALENPLLKVPCEEIKRALRQSQRIFEKDFAVIGTSLADLEQRFASSSTSTTNPPVEDAVKTMDAMVARLQSLKRKLEESRREEELYVVRCKQRMDHLNEVSNFKSAESEEFVRWNQVRLDRILVDYLLRSGFYRTAEKLAADSDIEHLVDISLFGSSRKVEESLRAKSCSECLQWCSENKSSLRKMNSSLEFNLRLQEFVELARQRRLQDAIAYSRKYLIAWWDTNAKEIQQAMALLAYPEDTILQPYCALYDSSRWQQLMEMFRLENYQLHSLTLQPLLSILLQAGLAALKTPSCYRDEDRNTNCPVCSDDIRSLSEKLPFSHHEKSFILCRHTGAVIQEDNPPLILPNGRLYSQQALVEIAKQSGGNIIDPKTGEVFNFNQAHKAFVV